ncbi:MAG: hypothetical protein ACK5F4_02680 [Ignavibacteria bacterium]
MKTIFTYLVSLLISFVSLCAQSGTSLKEFEKKLSDYYDPELIEDVVQTIGFADQVKVWSWDIGDFSSDEHNDLACVVRYSKEKTKQCSIFFFVDINGSLIPAGNITRDFVDSPLEVGVAIRDASCYVTSKKEQFNWNIVGYRYRHGIFFESDTFSTSRIGTQTMETFTDHVQRRNKIHVFSTRNEETTYYHHFHDIPAFKKGDIIMPCYAGPFIIDKADDVSKGAYFWKGPSDASVHILESLYDDASLHLTLYIKDDTLSEKICDSCIQDKLTIILHDRIPGYDPERIEKKQEKNIPSTYMVDIIPSFEQPYSSKAIVQEQRTGRKQLLSEELMKLKVGNDGYFIDITIPFSSMPEIDVSAVGSDVHSIGCTIILSDSDNRFRPEEMTQIQSSDYEAGNPRSLGILSFHPYEAHIGLIQPYFLKELTEALLQIGF